MKRILLLLFIVSSLSVSSQSFNNEWIDYSKSYYKFKLATTGLYRLPQALLSANGLGAVNADYFQLWRNGKQIPIYTTSSNAPIGAGGYIEFWGEMNDGKADKPLYRNQDWQLNDKWSLSTDTAFYFLTVNPVVGGNFRLTPTNNNVAGNTLSAEPFFMHTAGNYYREKINGGRAEIVGTSYTYSSSYDMGEGWTSNTINGTTSRAVTFPNILSYTGPGAPASNIRVSAAGDATYARNLKVIFNGDSVTGGPINYYDYIRVDQALSTAALGTSPVFYLMNTCYTGDDRMVVAQVELIYPRIFNFGGASNFNFRLPANSAGNYLEISNFSSSGPAPVLYDLTNGKRYIADVVSGLFRFALEGSAVARDLVMVDAGTANVINITSLQQRNFVNYLQPASQGNFLIISNPLFNGDMTSDPLGDYQRYRRSAAGGSFKAGVYMIDELVDQFAFGIKMHPLSIRNFVRWARAKYSVPVQYVLLVGKGVTYAAYRSNESAADINKLQLVPTFGYPASDNLLMAEGGSSLPLNPVGRLSVINKQELADYLEKVIVYEQVRSSTSPLIEDQAWRKQTVHVVGASDNATSDILARALAGWENIIEDTLYGATTATFKKTTSDAVALLSSAQLTALFNNGIGFLSYFGHSSANTLEFNLDNPNNYNNEGKYPVFNVMGCNAGNFFNYNVGRLYTKETISERYVLAKQRGSIAFMASTHLGIVHYLDIYATRMYRAMSRSNYGESLGNIMDEAMRQTFQLTTENDFYARFQCEQFTLHGDPAIKMYSFEKPDYAIEDPLVRVSPTFISIAESSFKVKASAINLGKSPARPIVVELKRTYPGSAQAVVIRRDTIRGIRYMDSLEFELDIVATRDKGLNRITVTIDPDNEIDELYESNNAITKDVYIFEDEIRPVYPYNFSIVNTPSVVLKASTANPFSESRQYTMELDTTELFNSNLKKSQSVTGKGGVIEFTPGISMLDSTVYYWRVAENVQTGELKWNTSSFIYITNSNEGFSQSHLYQHFKSFEERMTLDSMSRNWSFKPRLNTIFVNNGVYPTTSYEGGFFTGTINNVNGLIGPGCVYDELIFSIIDSATFHSWKNNYTGSSGLYESYRAVCGGGREYNFEYLLNTPEWRQKAMNFIDLIPSGYYVVVRTNSSPNQTGNTYASVWKNDELTLGAGNSLYHRFRDQGFADLDSFNRPRAFTLIFQKDGKERFAPVWTFSDSVYDAIVTSANPYSTDSLGYMNSPVVGPAKNWKELKWQGRTIDAGPGDSPTLDLIGITNNGTETVVVPGIIPATSSLDISSVDAEQYPFLKLRLRNADSVNHTPYQLKYWMLTFDPAPEGAIAPNLYLSVKDTIETGEPFVLGIGFKNISNYNFDSVKVKVTLTDRNNIETIIPVPKQKALTSIAPNDTLRLNVSVETGALAGHNTVFVNFNPDNDQPEQYLFNNYAFRNIYVKPDSLSPLLDVTFDGVHILNRDIVAARPDVLVKLQDEARWMVLDDTSLVSVKVRYPDGVLRQFYFNNSDTMTWIPAGQAPNTDNTASINLKPYFPQDGEYELIVTGKDQSDNIAGRSEYKVAFQVINKPMISNMLNYPNPFTTSTAFVFTLTGSEVPQNIRIQILTITGKIVREVTKEELGPLHIGRNMTEFKWDGTDQYGQKLANGIYLYRVITNLNGKTLDKYKAESEKTDKYFNKGYGKMYLMR
ncbi:MAG: C25 family cysteine peptidase [Chitinophagaceae bacterium]